MSEPITFDVDVCVVVTASSESMAADLVQEMIDWADEEIEGHRGIHVIGPNAAPSLAESTHAAVSGPPPSKP